LIEGREEASVRDQRLRGKGLPMPVFIALLRAVNLGSHGKVAMAELKAMFEGLDLPARTLLQSGNVVFSGKGTAKSFEQRLEKASAEKLGLKTDYFVRTAGEWDELIAANPFPKAARDDPSHLVVLALKEAPAASAGKALSAVIKGRETVELGSRAAYAVYPDGIGESKLTNAVIEKHLGTRATGRNWNTVLKLQALAKEMA
jgi:uncharacterized protein (DUF1697 family)